LLTIRDIDWKTHTVVLKHLLCWDIENKGRNTAVVWRSWHLKGKIVQLKYHFVTFNFMFCDIIRGNCLWFTSRINFLSTCE
jgi:hypothetical protein